ncbi:MAG: thiamine phosphate synthase [Desulfovibrio sp.]|nr:MAG: thiamine phosphate synthase [Desulfovibrio sp.]
MPKSRLQGIDLGLYLVTDRPLCRGGDLEVVVRRAVSGGATVVQLREKQASTREFVDLARRLKAMLDPLRIPLIINDRIDVALASGAAGAHVGQSDMRPEDARRLLGPDAILGLSVENRDQASEAESPAMQGIVDYLGVGPILPTATKTDTSEPWGVDGFAALAKTSALPLVAIGSVNLSNATELIRSGAAGIAVVSAIVAADDPEQAAKDLAHAVAQGRGD